MSTEYLVIADGGRRNSITYGSFKVYNDSGDEIAHQQFVIGDGTNNTAEYVSLIRALRYCLAKDWKNVTVMMDSKLVVFQTKGIWRCDEPQLKKYLGVAKKLIVKLDSYEINYINRRYIVQKLGH